MDGALKSNCSASTKHIALSLFTCFMLLELAVWGGDGGYLDLREYLDDTQRLWLKGDMRVTENPPTYTRYSSGLPVVGGPFLLIGHFLSKITNGWVNERGITALLIPVVGALAGVLLFLWALHIGVSQRAAVWSSLLFVLTTPLITYTQHYYTEALVCFCGIAAMYCYCKALSSADSWRWLALSGVALGTIPAAHNSSVLSCAGLWLGMSVSLLYWGSGALRERFARIAALTAAPFVIALALLWFNYHRFGSPFLTGYHVYFSEAEVKTFVLAKYIPANVLNFGKWIGRVPWLLVALPTIAVLYKRNQRFALPIIIGICLQAMFWLCYRDLRITTHRYLLGLTGLAALALPLAAEFLQQRWPKRALVYGLLVAFMYGLARFMVDDHFRPFYWHPVTGELVCYTWYQHPPVKWNDVGTPVHLKQWLFFLGLCGGGLYFMCRAWTLSGDENFAVLTGAEVQVHQV